MSMTASEVNDLKQAPAAPGVLPIFLRRWSPRSFSDRPVHPDDLRSIFEAARWAPSSNNEQPWRFLVGERGSDTYNKILESLVEFNRTWARTAPVLILGAASKTFSRNGNPNGYALHDLGQAAVTLCYQAIALGIFTHQMAGYDRDLARRLLAIPGDFELGSVLALGYQGDPEALPEGMQKTEIAPRTRKPLDSFVFSAWDQPAPLA
jgi:nitroreductase